MFIEAHLTQIVFTVAVIISFLIIRGITGYLTKKFARKSAITQHRTRRILKYFNFGFAIILLPILILVWGFEIKDLGWMLSSVFAVIGVALFATWSILSNITSGIIMFFTFPYRIGDFIVIHDNEYQYEGVIEEIKSFHVIIKTTKNEIITYPNSMLLQKGVTFVRREEDLFSVIEDGIDIKTQDENVKEQPID